MFDSERQAVSAHAAPMPRVAVALLLLVAAAFALAAVLCSWRIAAVWFEHLPDAPSFPADLSRTRNLLAALAVLLAVAAVAAAKLWRLHAWLADERVQNALLVGAFGIAPIVVLEIMLAPFFRPTFPKTTIFVRDAELGWRHRPGAADAWLGKTVRINAKGLRGPDLPYARSPGASRILFLGDSVTFGDRLGDDGDTLPARIGAALSARIGRPVEAINAGVSGYSPWQEARFLKNEGRKYAPDLVVLTFVLNDVTEKFGLRQFGGTGEGFQLAYTHPTYVDKWLDKSNIYRGIRAFVARQQFGPDTRAGARAAEQLTVKALVDFPQREDVQRAWNITFSELDEIVTLCRARGLPLAILVSPFAFQLENERLDAPQQEMIRYAERQQVKHLSLLEPLADHMRREQRRPEFYFIDSNHYSADGTRVVAELVAPLLQASIPPPLPASADTERR